MSERMVKVDLVPPHLKTKEGAARFDAAVEERNKADYDCFYVLREMFDNDLLHESRMILALKPDVASGCISHAEAVECAEEWASSVARALENRRKADAEFSNALLNRP